MMTAMLSIESSTKLSKVRDNPSLSSIVERAMDLKVAMQLLDKKTKFLSQTIEENLELL